MTAPQVAATVPGLHTSGLYDGLLDDAAMFPPGNATMADAVAGYARSLTGPDAPFVGSFVCSNPRLGELSATLRHLPRPELPVDLSLVVPGSAADLATAMAQVQADPRLRLTAVEVPAGADGPALTVDALDALLPAGVVGYVELPLDDAGMQGIEMVAASRHRVKLRTGGTVAGAFPSAARLARALEACLASRTAFKLTAGLHHAVRQRDESTGFQHHGFLNVLVALRSDAPDIVGVLEEGDRSALARVAAGTGGAEAARIRASFVSFGTCSTADPLTDLRALGLVP